MDSTAKVAELETAEKVSCISCGPWGPVVSLALPGLHKSIIVR